MKKHELPLPNISRRRFLSLGAGAALALAVTPVLAAPAVVSPSSERRLSFQNIHTGESLKTTYWQNGQYVAEEMAAINHILRDYRVNKASHMAPQLMDMLYALQQKLGTNQPYQVISGYRSPETNAFLHRSTTGVANHSRHMLGQAIDVRLPGKELNHLLHAAYDMRAGGVGYYPQSDFIHLDVGPYRTWNG